MSEHPRHSGSREFADPSESGIADTILTAHEAHVVHWTLRLAVAAEFIGHGAFGIITKAAWIPYFAVIGVPEWLAWRLMPLIGSVDIVLGILVLLRPTRVALLYMAIWGFWTALLRPLAGESWWEFLERAANFGVPFTLLYLSGWGRSWLGWFARIEASSLRIERAITLAWVLRLTTAALLIGHGGFGAFTQKPEWIGYLGGLGIDRPTVIAESLVWHLGWFEIALGLIVLANPAPAVLVFAFVWKVGTELLRPMVGEPFWEFVERCGSYAAPLALFYVSRAIDEAQHEEGDVDHLGMATIAT
jgi:hypothetical protein